ncbi:hypothetical protein FA13DRAFT_1727637 [Coprinellus micaceus]|uniref:Uncharacterized protein n=1 Tax=Coprinellus micaceus TaxID=71717 RepID=A0A4Y7TPG4_COPMI|nr:hypothetical protein FA13DRAFT_1727637 [Coprinellus micaceus]
MQNAGSGGGRISRPKARTSQLHGRPIEKAVSFAPSTPTSVNDSTPTSTNGDDSSTPIANAHPRTFAFDEKTGLTPLTNGNGRAGINGHGVRNNGAANGNGNPAPENLSAPRVQAPPPPPVSLTRGKRPAYSRRSLKPSAPRGILATPTQPHGNGNGRANGQQGQGHQRQASTAPLLAEQCMNENRGRRLGDPEDGLGEQEHQVRRTPSALLWNALGLGGGERNSRNSLRTRDSRWSWTSSLDMKLFGQRAHRENNGNSKSARTTVVGSVEEDRASGSMLMGVAM